MSLGLFLSMQRISHTRLPSGTERCSNKPTHGLACLFSFFFFNLFTINGHGLLSLTLTHLMLTEHVLYRPEQSFFSWASELESFFQRCVFCYSLVFFFLLYSCLTHSPWAAVDVKWVSAHKPFRRVMLSWSTSANRSLGEAGDGLPQPAKFPFWISPGSLAATALCLPIFLRGLC